MHQRRYCTIGSTRLPGHVEKQYNACGGISGCDSAALHNLQMSVPRTNIEGESDREQSSRSTCVSNTHFSVGQQIHRRLPPPPPLPPSFSSSPPGEITARNVSGGRNESRTGFLRSATTATAIYIQYFCKNVFSGGATTGVPSGVKGGGTRRLGLEGTRMPLACR